MNKEFVSYEQAVALKELGFNEPCMAIYYSKDKSFSWHHHKDHTNDEPALDSGEFNISALLYQQAFRWFREKHDLHGCIDLHVSNQSHWYFRIDKISTNDIYLYHSEDEELDFNTYEEAEQACLDKLIEIVKNGKHV